MSAMTPAPSLLIWSAAQPPRCSTHLSAWRASSRMSRLAVPVRLAMKPTPQALCSGRDPSSIVISLRDQAILSRIREAVTLKRHMGSSGALIAPDYRRDLVGDWTSHDHPRPQVPSAPALRPGGPGRQCEGPRQRPQAGEGERSDPPGLPLRRYAG